MWPVTVLVIDHTLVTVSRRRGRVRAASRWGVTPATVSALEHERDRLTARIAVTTRNRDAIADYLTELRTRSA